MFKINGLFLVMFGLLAAHVVHAADSSSADTQYIGGNRAFKTDEAHSYFDKIRAAISSDDISWLSKNISYPLRASTAEHHLIIRNASEFANKYKELINVTVKEAVACQSFDNIFSNSQGLMIGQGAIWFDLIYIGNKPMASSASTSELEASFGDRTKWDYRITVISHDQPVIDYVKRCNANQK